MSEPKPGDLYDIVRTPEGPVAIKSAFVNRRWLDVLNSLQRNRNAGCRYAIVDLRTFEVGIIVAMEKGGS
jgi:hypothetical protein